MKKFIRNILIFFAALVLVDVICGKAFQYMNDHSKGGGIKSRHYVCKESNEDVLVFGSSRAKHHYVPDVIEDSLGMTCYNTGEDGNGIILSYGFLKMVTTRYQPKLIIYDVTGFDVFEDDNMKYLDLMKPFYHEPGVDSIFWRVNPKTRFMMMSNMYRYNTTCLRVFGNYIHPMNTYPKGYLPLYGTMSYEPESKTRKEQTVDSLKIECFKNFIAVAQKNNIQLVCCVSPAYKSNAKLSDYEPIMDLCQRYDVPFLYHLSDENISYDKQYFKDATHMNDGGARLYTARLMNEIRQIGLN